jgi:ATP-dependent Clp protease adapter protein ClpS/Zn-dependent protease
MGRGIKQSPKGAEQVSDQLVRQWSGEGAKLHRLFSVGDVEVRANWFIVAGCMLLGWFASAFTSQRNENFLFCTLAVVLLVVVHECGHAFAAKLVGVKIYALELSGAGGLCRIDTPKRVRDAAFIFSAGILAQLVTLLLTVLTTNIAGYPTAPIAESVYVTFTLGNTVMVIINLIPTNLKNGLQTDGKVLWQLFLYKFGSGSNPFGPVVFSPDESPVFPPETSLLTKPELIPQGFNVGIEILNDKVTPMEVVVSCLSKHLDLNRNQAIMMMVTIHNKGGVLVSITTFDRAVEIAKGITNESRAAGHNLTCRAVQRYVETNVENLVDQSGQ